MNAPSSTRHVPDPTGRFPWLMASSLVLALGLLASGILLVQSQLRAELRAQLANRDAQSLAHLVRRQLATAANTGDPEPLPALLEALILPELPGVRDVQLYDARRQPTLNLLRDARAHPPAVAQFDALDRAWSERDPASDSILPPLAVQYQDSHPPLLTVVVPLEAGTSAGVRPAHPTGYAAFTLDGSSLAAEFVQLDRTLRRRGAWVFGLLGSVMAGMLGYTFHRLLRADRLLRQRTAHLEAANRELTLSAKASAVGAVTAHLVHGLKNPLAGLQDFVSNLEAGVTAPERADAAATARRMKAMIDDVVRVLRDEQGLTAFAVSASDVLAHVRQRLGGPARELGIHLDGASDVPDPLSNRCANLAALVLENLGTNALQALRPGGHLRLQARSEPGAVVFEVRDDGPGLPASIREHLFEPGLSTKSGGTGLGLALSHHLARSIDGDLSLVESNGPGTTFALRVPTTPGSRS